MLQWEAVVGVLTVREIVGGMVCGFGCFQVGGGERLDRGVGVVDVGWVVFGGEAEAVVTVGLREDPARGLVDRVVFV